MTFEELKVGDIFKVIGRGSLQCIKCFNVHGYNSIALIDYYGRNCFDKPTSYNYITILNDQRVVVLKHDV